MPQMLDTKSCPMLLKKLAAAVSASYHHSLAPESHFISTAHCCRLKRVMS